MIQNHLKGLLKKNYILWKRDLKGTCCELFIPIFFCFIVFLLRLSIVKEDVSELDYLPISQKLTPAWDPSLIANGIHSTIQDCTDKNYGGKVGLAPDIPITQALAKVLQQYPDISVAFFKDKKEYDNHITGEGYIYDYPPQICFGIVFTEWNNGNYNYQISFNLTLSTEVPYQQQTSFIVQEQDSLVEDYINSGFTRIVNFVSNIILQQESGNQNLKITPKLSPIKREAYTKDNIATYLGQNMNFYIVLPMIASFLRMTSRILSEKEKRIKEGMMMMGLGKSPFYLSWVITYLVYYFFLSLLVTIILKFLVVTYTDFFVFFFYYYLYCIALLTQSLFITVFFTRQRPGILTATVYFLLQFIFTMFMMNKINPTSSDYQTVSIFPQSAVGIAARVFLIYEGMQKNFGFSDVNRAIDQQKLIYSFNSCIINSIIYLVLFLYLDQVFPNEFGQKKHPLFFLGINYSSNIKKSQQTPIKEDDVEALIEDIDAEKKKQENEGRTIQIQDLEKIFQVDGQQKIAVNRINLQIYSGQVFSFLGHNGAGKTTTMSILTGMLSPTSGTAYIKGLDIRKDMDQIRKFLGVCPQHDILFDQLTVKEHLELFATLKGMPADKIESAITKIIKDVDLVEKTNIVSSSLSGGQKRKLSVAIAFIGGSDVIILDEPTSGMDVSARRHIWDMLKNYKSSKIIILTTHFMDEADYLGDRIGIISDGKIKCIGSNVFLKDSYGAGYNFTFVKEENNSPSQPIIELMKKYIPDCEIISDVSAEVAFQVPKKHVPVFQELFATIEKDKKRLMIRSYGVSNTTLEQVFLKVASMNENHFILEKKQSNVKEQQSHVDFDFNKERIKGKLNIFKTHLWALMVKRFRYFKRDSRSFVCELLLPIIMILIGFLASTTAAFNDWPNLQLTLDQYNDFNQIYIGGQMNNVQNYLQKYQNSENIISSSPTVQDFNNELFEKKTTDLKIGLFVTSNLPTDYQYYSFVNSINPNMAPISINMMNNAIINQILGRDIKIIVNNQPLLLTAYTKSFSGTVKGIVISLIFSIGMAFIPASLITYIVREREEHIKHQQIVSGVSLWAYWLSNFLIDLFKYLVPALISPFFAYAFNISAITDNGSFGYFYLIFILYGPSMISFVYVCSFLHKDYGNAQLIQFFFNFIIGGIGSVTFAVLRLIDTTKYIAIKLHYIFRLFPCFSYAYGISNLASLKAYQLLYNYSSLPSQMDLNMAGGDILFLILMFIFFISILILIESFRARKTVLNRESNFPYIPKPMDDDVQSEKNLIETANPSEYTILVRNLRKVFIQNNGKPKVAVDNINFGLKYGEVFCFLGTNGAGKTTTMRMLTGEETIGSGEAYIEGYKIPEQMSIAQQYIGYCPQFDALLDNLTAREHLELYAAIKGIPKDMIPRAVDEKLDEMNLRKFEHICSRTYSGGNKRKLSVAIAMLANPPIVFLDEPSTGMDPGNRRFMWDVISRIATLRKKSSIILTTHSMEEAEALGTKVGIVVSGNLQCLGSIQHLKNKFGKGYELDIKTKLPTVQELSQMAFGKSLNMEINSGNIENILKEINQVSFTEQICEKGFAAQIFYELQGNHSVELQILLEKIYLYNLNYKILQFLQQNADYFNILEQFNNFMKVQIATKKTIGEIFGMMYESQERLHINSYMVNQTTLEQIFNEIAHNCEQQDLAAKGSSIVDVNNLKKSQSQQIQRQQSQQSNKVMNIYQLPLHNQQSTNIQMQTIPIHKRQ
ncbi:hypothetical protein ABPG74_012150 [Tetrahymena malaccensis]